MQFLKMEKPEILRVASFVFWGTINTAASFLVYCAFIYVGTPIAIASLFSLIFGILLGHYLNKKNVFNHEGRNTLPRYFLVWTCLYCVNLLILYQLMGVGFNAYLAGGLAAFLIVPFSYLLQRFFVFNL